MGSRGRSLILLAVAFLAIGLVAAAVSRGTLPPADYSFINNTEPKTLDPHNAAGVPEGRLVWELFEGLCRWDPKTLEPLPGVAERWEISDDGLTYTFHFRASARWSDGSPVTADDFAWSFRRLLHPATAAEYAYELWYLVNAERYTTRDIKIGDRVEVELLTPPAGALPYAAGEIVRGTLLAIEDAGGQSSPTDDDKVFVVETGGRQRRFCKRGGEGLEAYRWLLIDFDTVGVRVIDARTLEVRLQHPVPYFLTLTGYYPLFPVNRRCVETHGWPAWIRPENIVTNGPFRLHSRRVRDRVRLVKSDTYWDRENVHLNIVDALAVESETTGLNMYLTGQADYISDYLPTSVIPSLRASGRPDFTIGPYLGTYMYRVNVTRKPLDDVRVRRALNLAIDKQAIVEHVTKAGQIPARSIVPPAIEKYLPYKPAYCGEFNVAEARRLLAEAGFAGGVGFPKIGLLYNPVEMHASIAQVLQAQWKQNLGIDIELEQQEWGAYQTAQRMLDYDLARYAWIGDYPDPNTFLKMWITDGGNNQTGWSNREYDRLIDTAQRETDPQKRLEHFHQAERILMDELPIIPLFYYVTTNLLGPYVHGIYPNVQNVHPLKNVRIDWEEKARFRPQGPFGAPSTGPRTRDSK